MESYVERWKREQQEKKAAAQKKPQKKQKAQKEVNQDGENTRGKGHEAQSSE